MNPFVKFLSNVKWTLPFFIAGSAILAARMSFRPGESVSAFVVGPEGDILVTGTSLGQVSVWDLNSLKKTVSVDVPCQVKALDISRDGKKIVYGGQGGEIGLLKLENKKFSLIKNTSLPGGKLQDVTFSEKEKYFVAANPITAQIFLIDSDLNIINNVLQPGNGVQFPFASETNDYIAHCGQVFWVWDLNKVKNTKYKNIKYRGPDFEKMFKECHRAELGGSAAIEALPFSDFKKALYIGTYTGDEGHPRTVALWDAVSGKLEPILLKQEPMTGGAISPDDRFFATSHRSGMVHVFNTSDKKQVAEYLFNADIPASQRSFTHPVERIRFVKGKSQLVCLTVDSRLFLWDFKTGRIQHLN